MIHKIKALHSNGEGLSARGIASALNISRNTVRKYLRMDETDIVLAIEDQTRIKELDRYAVYIEKQLALFPNLSAVKIARKLRKKVPNLSVSDRSIRRFVQALKAQCLQAQQRYYEPIIDMLPGVQCQVDPGELRGMLINGKPCTLHFVVFVLSFSRLMYVGLSFKPINTQTFLQLHDEAFRYFGGVPEECVYDQTKLVVIKEEYREISINPRFHQYATAVNFRIHACEGYDPESKGKVEAGVKYVKQDCFYGETFTNKAEARLHIQSWLDDVANKRCHGTTGKEPRSYFDEQEKAHLNPYLKPDCLHELTLLQSRQVDKTGLISWASNKYSVPMAWQRARINVEEQCHELIIMDPSDSSEIARHLLCSGKGQIIKNTNHYRDPQERIGQLEHAIIELIGEDLGGQLSKIIKLTEPKIVKDQLKATRDLLKAHSPVNMALIHSLVERDSLTATQLRRYLDADHIADKRGREKPIDNQHETLTLDLSRYASIGQSSGHGVTHESA